MVLTWEALGQKQDPVINERLISSVTAVEKMKQNWEPAGVRTNDVTPRPMLSNAPTDLFRALGGTITLNNSATNATNFIVK
jgi:hypothetical protein